MKYVDTMENKNALQENLNTWINAEDIILSKVKQPDALQKWNYIVQLVPLVGGTWSSWIHKKKKKKGTMTNVRGQREERMRKLVFGELLFDEILFEQMKTFSR